MTRAFGVSVNVPAIGWARFALTLVAIGACAARAGAATPGFVEDFTAGSAGFQPSSTVTHVASGGVGGAGDPYIQISSDPLTGFVAAFSAVAEVTGNLPADGVTGYSFWLRDTGANDDLEIHVGVGIAFVNVWLSIPGFNPPDGQWQRFGVDLTDPSQWVQIIGSGTFQEALAGSNRLLFRHDVPPLVQLPEAVVGEFGLDRITVLPRKVPSLATWGGSVLAAALLAVGALGLARRRAALRRAPG